MNLDPYRIASEPYYEPLGREIEAFKAAYAERLPVMLKGPTGCGKTRFVEHMAWLLDKPLITVAAHEDMTAANLARNDWRKRRCSELIDRAMNLRGRFLFTSKPGYPGYETTDR